MVPDIVAAAVVAASEVALRRWFDSGAAVPLRSPIQTALEQLAEVARSADGK